MSQFLKQREAQAKQINQEVQAYVNNFLATAPIAKRAQNEGWMQSLTSFVYSTASTMVYIKHNPNKPYGWNGAILPRNFQHNYSVLIKQSIPSIRATGSFDVMDAMPTMLPNYWQAANLPHPQNNDTLEEITLASCIVGDTMQRSTTNKGEIKNDN